MGIGGAPQHSQSPSLFILSFRHRDELAAAVDRAGWRAIAARRGEGAERRFLSSGATIAIVDARGAFEDGLTALRALRDAVQANAAGLIALVSSGDVERLSEVHAAGATHYLASPFGEGELAQALRFAQRFTERLGGGGAMRSALHEADAMLWSCGAGGLLMSPELRKRLGAGPDPVPVRFALRQLQGDARVAIRAARVRLRAGLAATAVAHDAPGGGRVVHHLSLADGRLSGFVEQLAPEAEGNAAHKDAATGLYDAAFARRWLGDRLRRGARLGVILIGFARLERLNREHGRAAGDALLQAAARRALRAGGEADRRAIVARLAATEFLVAVPGADGARVRAIADSLFGALDKPVVAGAQTVVLGPRLGAVCAEPGETPEILLRRASAALAEARDESGPPVTVMDASESQAVSYSMKLAGEVGQALAAGAIEVLFQPQVHVATGEIVGVEALARWRHPELGELGAEALFAAAERADLLVPLSENIQARALAVAAAWPDSLSALRLSVNVTADELRRPNFLKLLLARIATSGFPKQRLTIEITESGLIQDLAVAADALSRLRHAGCRVAIDDFGTGYSSLAYLKALPLDYLKIDKGLTDDISGSPRGRVVVRGVIEMGRSLDLGVIAEGVEREDQLAALAAEGCTLYQGFLCSEPIGVDALAALMEGNMGARRRTSAM